MEYQHFLPACSISQVLRNCNCHEKSANKMTRERNVLNFIPFTLWTDFLTSYFKASCLQLYLISILIGHQSAGATVIPSCSYASERKTLNINKFEVSELVLRKNIKASIIYLFNLSKEFICYPVLSPVSLFVSTNASICDTIWYQILITAVFSKVSNYFKKRDFGGPIMHLFWTWKEDDFNNKLIKQSMRTYEINSCPLGLVFL